MGGGVEKLYGDLAKASSYRKISVQLPAVLSLLRMRKVCFNNQPWMVASIL